MGGVATGTSIWSKGLPSKVVTKAQEEVSARHTEHGDKVTLGSDMPAYGHRRPPGLWRAQCDSKHSLVPGGLLFVQD